MNLPHWTAADRLQTTVADVVYDCLCCTADLLMIFPASSQHSMISAAAHDMI